MADGPEEARYREEALRLVQALKRRVRMHGVSIRSLEKRMGVGDSVFNKVLKGEVTLQLRHVLMICDALGVDWKEFFAEVYELEAKDRNGELEERMTRHLIRLGLFHPDKADPPSGGD
jgi:transcriptional regulator with XRE-family HTH domain